MTNVTLSSARIAKAIKTFTTDSARWLSNKIPRRSWEYSSELNYNLLE